MPDVQIIGHRGARGLVPFENTVDSFEKALEEGADMIEFDVRRTGDNALVIHHDADIDGRPLANMDLGELRAAARGKGFEVPLLRDVLTDFRGRTRFDIELKEVGYEEQIMDVVCDCLSPREFIFKSFHDSTVTDLKQINEKARVGLLVGVDEPANPIRTRLSEVYPEIRLARCHADFVSPHYKLLRAGFMTRMRRLGYPVFVWTVNESDLMRSLIDKGVDGLITDHPDRASALLR